MPSHDKFLYKAKLGKQMKEKSTTLCSNTSIEIGKYLITSPTKKKDDRPYRKGKNDHHSTMYKKEWMKIPTITTTSTVKKEMQRLRRKNQITIWKCPKSLE